MALKLEKPLKFIHITKTAGTTIEKIGEEAGIQWGKNHGEYGQWHRFFDRVPQEVKRKYDWFMVVRNPYDRIISEFYCHHGGHGFSLCEYNHTPEIFNKFCKKKIKYRSSTGDHWSEQHKYLDFTPCHILKFENLKEEFEELMRDYNLYLKLDKKENSNKYPFSKRFGVDDMDDELIEYINGIYDKDFKEFNYEKISRPRING